MKYTPIEVGESILKPRARLIKTIGEDLISNDVVAIIELVKNSYDANSPIVTIEFIGEVVEIEEGKKRIKVIPKGSSNLIIEDQGGGMDLDIIKNVWMEPATIYKKTNKNKNPKRRFTGEKGIGRFASAKLADKLDIITKQENGNEVVVNFNWNDFSDDSKYLSDIKTKWEVRSPILIRTSGTILRLDNLLSNWDESKIRELRIALSRLLSPIAPSEDFLIELKLPKGLENLDGLIERPGTLNRPDYYIKGSVLEDGVPNIIYYSKNVGKEEKLDQNIVKLQLKDPVRSPICGPFSFEFRIWNRDSDSIKNLAKETNSTVKNVKNDLDDLAGITIYRDNFRVLPYGNKDDDWLRLDIRRVNNPTKSLSNNQIVGYVSISLDNNPDLKDQSNREGLVQSQAFEDLKEYIKLILNEVEIKRYNERPRGSDALKNIQEGLFNRFSLETITKYLAEHIPDNLEVIDFVKKKDVEIQEGVKKVQEVISRYRRLANLGQLIDVILHDGGNYLARIDNQVQLIKKELTKKNINQEKIEEKIFNIENVRNDFAQLFKRIEPFGGRKRGRPKNVIVEEIIKNQFALAHSALENLNVKCILPSTINQVTIDEGELGMIIMNLLENSIYWLGTVETERLIEVGVERDIEELSIIFRDSGPGVREDSVDTIFDAYFSTKTDGIGLGLSIVGELVTEYNGELALIDNGPQGATFQITFKYRV